MSSFTVVHVITRFIRGGADENTLITCNGQLRQGMRVHLVIGAECHSEIVEKLDSGVCLHKLSTLVREISPAKDIKCLFTLKRMLRDIKPDIVHTHESKAGFIGRLAAVWAGVPTIVHGVHILPFLNVGVLHRSLYLALERISGWYTDLYIHVSPALRNICLKHRLGPPGSHIVVPSGMDVQRFRNVRIVDAVEVINDTRVGRTASGTTPVLVLIAGALEPRKRVGELILALAKHTSNEEWRLLVAGDGRERQRLAVLVDALDLRDKVLLLGHRNDMERLIAASDLCVHAACNEGLPRVVVQHVLGDRPVISTYLPGIEELITPGVNGELVENYDVDSLAQAVLSLCRNREQLDRYAAASRKKDLSSWDADKMIDQIEAAYRSARQSRVQIR